jgi:flagellar biosynthesis protein FlhG
MSEVIVFTSGKGGVGKSNLCLNTALQLAAQHYRTCLFDGDLGLANVNILLGIEQEHTLDDVVFNNRSLDEILVQTGYGFDIIPGSSGVEQIADLSEAQLESLIAALAGVGDYDYFLIDTASGISKSVISFCLAARQTVIVITREATSLTDAYALLKILSLKGYQGSVRILINNCDSIPQAKKTYLRYKRVVDKHLDIAIAPAGIVLHDEHFEQAVVQQRPLLDLYPESIGAQCLRAFVANLIRENDQPGKPETLGVFWQRYLKLIKEDSFEARPAGRQIQQDPDHRQPAAARMPEREPVAATPAAPMFPGLPTGLSHGGSAELHSALFDYGHFMNGLSSSPVLLGALYRQIGRGQDMVSLCRKLLVSDPVLMSRLLYLQIPDSKGYRAHIQDLDELFDLLDEDRLQGLFLQASMQSLQGKAQEAATVYLKRWLHSLSCAILAKDIARAGSFAFPEEAYVCGLMHDIGYFIEAAWTGAGSSGSDGSSSAEVDIWPDIAGSHARIGAEYLQTLGLNNMMCDAVRFHHHPLDQVCTGFDLVRIVFGANALLNEREPASDPDEALIGLLGLPREQVLDLLAQARAKAQETVDSLGLEWTANLLDNAAPEDTAAGGNGIDDAAQALGRHLLNHLLTGSVMPPLLNLDSLTEWTRRIHWSCSLLFGFRRIICFLADSDNHRLTATGFPGCFSAENLDNFVITVDNKTSLLSRSFTEGRVLAQDLSSVSEGLNLSDYQLGRLLGDEALLCIPLKSSEQSAGLIVCGISAAESTAIDQRLSHLAELGFRAARDLAVLRQQIL